MRWLIVPTDEIVEIVGVWILQAGGGARPSPLVDAPRDTPALVPGKGGGSNRLGIGHRLDAEPSTNISMTLPLEESDRLAHSTRCPAPSRTGRTVQPVTSNGDENTTVVSVRSAHDRFEAPRVDALAACSDRGDCGCLDSRLDSPYGRSQISDI